MPVKLDAYPPGKPHELPIAKPEIMKMIKEYEKKNGKNDAKSCWVSKEEIMQLLKDNDAKDQEANGIRIHYGRHVKPTMPKIGKEYKGKHTVILVATIDCLNPKKPIPENSEDQLNDDPKKGKVNSVTYTSSYKGMGDDYVPLCPPRCRKP